MTNRIKWLAGIILGLGLVAAGINYSAAAGPRVEREYALHAERTGAFRGLVKELQKDGIIHSERLFRLVTRLTRSDRKLSTGYYTFDNRMGILGILGKIRRGEANRVSVVVREGADLFEIAAEAAQVKAVESTADFLEHARARSLLEKIEKRFSLEKKIASAEGFLYPDTYSVRKGAGFQELADLALSRFEAAIAAPYRRRAEAMRGRGERPQNLWYYLRAASLIERETPTQAERPLVASVIENRLRINDKLRFDPSVIYAMKLEGLYQKNLTGTNAGAGVNIKSEHFGIKSRWNTYWVGGLPAGPICNPSAASFEAAMEPARTDYLFFVAKGVGVKEHAFSRTYEEHQKLTRKYLLGR